VDDDELTKDLSRGTGKESIEIDEIIKKL